MNPAAAPPSISAPRLLTLSTALLVTAILLPLAAVAVFGVRALGDLRTLTELAESVLPGYVANTVVLSALAAVVALALGLPTAWFVSAYQFPGSRVLLWSLVVPMAMPAYVLAYAYTDALDPSGWLYREIAQALLTAGMTLPRLDIRSVWGAGIVLGVALSPYVSLLAKTAFDERQGAAVEAARAMGLSGTQVFFRVALPLARPAWIAGVALVVMECFADYGTVAFFAVPTLSTGLFKAWFNYGDRGSADPAASPRSGRRSPLRHPRGPGARCRGCSRPRHPQERSQSPDPRGAGHGRNRHHGWRSGPDQTAAATPQTPPAAG